MSAVNARRGFLRGLVALPFVGGGVTLIGAPSAVAEPVTDQLLREYANWVAHEHYQAQTELYGTMDRHWYALHGPAWRWHRQSRDARMQPSSRAALVMSAVGCDWREGDQ